MSFPTIKPLGSCEFFEVALDVIRGDAFDEFGLGGNDHYFHVVLADLLLHSLLQGRQGQFLCIFKTHFLHGTIVTSLYFSLRMD